MKPNKLLQQCLAASKESLIEIDPNGELIQRQLWKMSGTSLISKANIWQSKHEWKLKSVGKEAGKIYIEITSKDKVFYSLVGEPFINEDIIAGIETLLSGRITMSKITKDFELKFTKDQDFALKLLVVFVVHYTLFSF